jgi:hypothetical protein
MDKWDRSPPGPVRVRADDPLRYAASNAAVPTAREAAIVERLWDDPDFERRHRELAIHQSRRYDAAR